MVDALHHMHKRKRIHQKHESYPHPDKWKNLMDKFIYVICIFGPVMTIPQILKIWVHKNAAGVSVISWSAYMIVAISWLMYGIVHKERPIIFSNCMWLFLEVFIVSGILVYG